MAQAEDMAGHPFVTALPPETDYISYLTIVEAHLDKQALPLLNSLLQDGRLTTNIGWDLVHLLAPLLPESGECLQTIARLGNPREVVLKVNEMLEMIGYDAAAADESDATSEVEPTGEGLDAEAHAQDKADDEQQRLRTLQFRHLLRMIGVLHPRIKTKRPSRFLVTIVEAVMHAYRHLPSKDRLNSPISKPDGANMDVTSESGIVTTDIGWNQQSATDCLLDLLTDLSTTIRPPLPPRLSSSSVPTQASAGDDPEAEPVDAGEGVMQRRILISLATHISETLNGRMRECLPGEEISWTQQYLRENLPQKMVRHGRPQADPGVERMARSIQGALRKLQATLRSKFGLRAGHLLGVVSGADELGLGSLDEFPISDRGALCLLAQATFEGEGVENLTLADHRLIVADTLGSSSSMDFGPESLAVMDAVLFLGWKAVESRRHIAAQDVLPDSQVGAQETQESYNGYLQQLSVISANAPYPGLRYQAHLLVTTIIQQTADAGLKCGFIRDTLEFCPFFNLRVTAIGWLKDEMLAAFEPRGGEDGHQERRGVFGRAETLESVAISVFDASETSDEVAVPGLLPFWLAGLNLLYMVCCNDKLREGLKVAALVQKYDVDRRFIKPLERLAEQMTTPERTSNRAHGEGISDAGLLTDAVSRARQGVARLGG